MIFTLESLLAELEVQCEPVEDEVAEEVVEIEDLTKYKMRKYEDIYIYQMGWWKVGAWNENGIMLDIEHLGTIYSAYFGGR